MSKLRSAIVGCGSIHGSHIEAIQALGDDVELVAACDEEIRRSGAVGEKHGVGVFTELEAMLDWGKFDILHVCTPSGKHAACGILGAKAGKHVLCEKPIDVTLPAADALIAACDHAGVRLAVVSQHRYSPGMRHLKGWLDEGKLGRLVYGESVTKWFRTQAYYDSGGWRGTWELDGGGALMNQGVHYVDQLRWIMGPVRSVAATMGTLAHERIEVEDVVSATIEFESGAVGTLMASTSLVPGYNQSLEIYGTHGSVLIDNGMVRHAQFLAGDEEQTTWAIKAPEPLVKDGVFAGSGEGGGATSQGGADPRAISVGGHIAHLSDLIASIRTGSPVFMNGPEARNALELIVTVYEAARTGKRVVLGERA
ncbi:MAG: Gfo/Idh/MocA family protein [Armatimonadota bacterium]